MAIEAIEATNTPNEGRVIINDNFVDLEGRLNEVEVGVDAFTTTTLSFVQPAADATVSVSVDNTLWMAVGQPVYMVTGGHYIVSSVTDATTVVLTNLGAVSNAAPAATVASGKKVSPSGEPGVGGGSGDAADITFTPAGTIAAANVQDAIEEVAAEAGSSAVAPVTITTNTTADPGDHTYLVNATSGAVTLTLPTAVGIAGKEFIVKKIDSSSNLVTVDGDGSETIDGAASVNTDLQWDSVTVESDGTNWQTTSPPTGGGGSGGDAVDITFTPAGTISATDVQAAIEEVASEASGGGRSVVVLGSDVANSTTTYADVTGLSYAVTSGTMYRFYVQILYDSSATTIGSRWSLSGPASPTVFTYAAEWASSSTALSERNSNVYDATDTATATSNATSSNVATLWGFIKPSTTGTLIVRFASETLGTITAKAGSTLEVW